MKSDTTYYIRSMAVISPQETFDTNSFLETVKSYDGNVLSCIAPDYKLYINPVQLRRLSRMLRMGLSAATVCLRRVNVVTPDSIIAATGYGFLEDTAKFLNEVLLNNESQLTPTFFMQSTYNALAGLIALQTKCMGYNTTYVNKGFAFETALQDALMQIEMNTAKNVLVSTFEELSSLQYVMNGRIGQYKKELIKSHDLYNSTTTGTLQGEGTASVLLSNVYDEKSLCVLKGVHTIYKPKDASLLKNELQQFLAGKNLNISEIDLMINGISGDIENDKLIKKLASELFSKTKQVCFKHLIGEYCTASAFAFWIASMILKKQIIPDTMLGNEIAIPPIIKNVLIVNQYMGKNYSFILLGKKN